MTSAPMAWGTAAPGDQGDGRCPAPTSAARRNRARTGAVPMRCVSDCANANSPAPAAEARRAPVAEDQRGQALEASAGDLVLVVGPDVDGQPRAAEPGQRARDRDPDVLDLVDGDAERVGRRRLLADGPQAQAEGRAPQQVSRDRDAGPARGCVVNGQAGREAPPRPATSETKNHRFSVEPAEHVRRLPAEQRPAGDEREREAADRARHRRGLRDRPVLVARRTPRWTGTGTRRARGG